MHPAPLSPVFRWWRDVLYPGRYQWTVLDRYGPRWVSAFGMAVFAGFTWQEAEGLTAVYLGFGLGIGIGLVFLRAVRRCGAAMVC